MIPFGITSHGFHSVINMQSLCSKTDMRILTEQFPDLMFDRALNADAVRVKGCMKFIDVANLLHALKVASVNVKIQRLRDSLEPATTEHDSWVFADVDDLPF
jgi:hypothetical protein